MSIALEVTLMVVLVAIAVGLIPLLVQLRRTAQTLEAFLLSTRKDLSQIAEDVHVSRMRMDHMAVSLQSSINEVAAFTGVLGDVGRTLKQFQAGFQSSIESTSRKLGGIVGGISAALSLFQSRTTSSKP